MTAPAIPAVSELSQEWVTKTELMTYVRCPYTYSLLHRGEIDPADLFDDFILDLIAQGQEFHDRVDAMAPSVELTSLEQLDELLEQGTVCLHPPLLFNEELKIYGQPDGIDPRNGAFWPIEYKSHKDVRPSDELELAFYWLLLTPRRTTGTDNPKGVIILRRDDEPWPVEVVIPSHRIAQVTNYLAEVRQARITPAEPRLCKCHVCTNVRRDEVRRSTIARRHVSLLHGVGFEFERALSGLKVRDYLGLLEWDPDKLAAAIRHHGGPRCSASMIRRWQEHARAFQEGAARVFGDPPPLGDAFIVVDLEYLTPPWGERIWLAGAAVVTGAGPTQFHQFWADDTDENERVLLDDLRGLLGEHLQLPIVTWAGRGADLPAMGKAARRLQETDPFLGREHIDLYLWAQRSFRLPAPSLGLKEVAEYFAVPHNSDIADGMQAQMLYFRADQPAELEPAVKQRLLAYNRDDLDATLAVAQEIKALTLGAGVPSPRFPQSR